jgi:hypothetical protein
MTRGRQLELALAPSPGWGGRRKGAGRKRAAGARVRVPHVARLRHDRHVPKLVTLRAVSALRCLRSDRVFPEPRRRLARCSRHDFRVVEFSVQRDHVHLIAEAEGHEAFERGMRGLATRLAIGANRSLSRRGRVWDDRFHARALLTPRAVRTALVYVLGNVRKHCRGGAPLIDPCSSAPSFDGFRDVVAARAGSGEDAAVAPRTWLLRLGWRRHGLISIREGPRIEAR